MIPSHLAHDMMQKDQLAANPYRAQALLKTHPPVVGLGHDHQEGAIITHPPPAEIHAMHSRPQLFSQVHRHASRGLADSCVKGRELWLPVLCVLDHDKHARTAWAELEVHCELNADRHSDLVGHQQSWQLVAIVSERCSL